jgi:hypothetical protein
MNFDPGFWNNSFWSNSLIIISAILDWVTLVVDPKGIVVPEYVARNIKITDPNKFDPALMQSPEQKSQWEQLIGSFHNRMVDLSNIPEDTFSEYSIASIKSYLMRLPSYDEMTKNKRYPANRIVHLKSPDHVQEYTKAQWLTEYMLHLDEEGALHFLESVAIMWAVELPQDQLNQLKNELLHLNNDNPKSSWIEAELRGYALYRIAEGLEH